MRILKNPNPVEEIVTCPECECEFEFTGRDIKSNNILGSLPKRYVLCPNCGKKIIIEENIQEPESLGPDIGFPCTLI